MILSKVRRGEVSGGMTELMQRKNTDTKKKLKKLIIKITKDLVNIRN